MRQKNLVILLGSYLGAGIATAAFTVYLSSNGKNHFVGFGSVPHPVLGMIETVVAWPYALFVNIRGK